MSVESGKVKVKSRTSKTRKENKILLRRHTTFSRLNQPQDLLPIVRNQTIPINRLRYNPIRVQSYYNYIFKRILPINLDKRFSLWQKLKYQTIQFFMEDKILIFDNYFIWMCLDSDYIGLSWHCSMADVKETNEGNRNYFFSLFLFWTWQRKNSHLWVKQRKWLEELWLWLKVKFYL